MAGISKETMRVQIYVQGSLPPVIWNEEMETTDCHNGDWLGFRIQ